MQDPAPSQHSLITERMTADDRQRARGTLYAALGGTAFMALVILGAGAFNADKFSESASRTPNPELVGTVVAVFLVPIFLVVLVMTFSILRGGVLVDLVRGRVVVARGPITARQGGHGSGNTRYSFVAGRRWKIQSVPNHPVGTVVELRAASWSEVVLSVKVLE